MEEKKDIGDQLAMWPKEIYSDEQYIEKFATFCTQHEPTQRSIVKILLKPSTTKHYGIEINFMELLDFDYKAASCLLSYPEYVFPLFDKAILEAEATVKEQHHRSEDMLTKEFVHARLARITKCEEHTKFVMPKASEIGKFIEISGTVIRTGAIKSIEWYRKYECITCKGVFTIEANIEQKNAFQKMYICPSGTCKSKGFKYVEGSAINRDYQEIKMQETIGSVGVGSIPRSLHMVLVDDLTDSCKAGDDIIVTGIVKRRWRWINDGERCDIEILLFANALRVSNEQRLGCNLTEETITDFRRFWDKYKNRPLYGRNLILRSICPNIYGLFAVKLSLAVTLIGGVPCQTKNGLRVRGESHLLLVGEPGTGKSQFLKFATMLSMRSVLTTGIGSTSAGLTVTAVKESGGEWALEAGALVLADCGVCCIDEFSSIKERDRATIHEAMEQQTLSIAKAGLVCKLQTRTTVIAATNPKGKYDTDQNLSVNTTLASPLLSRFDLILVLLDSRDIEWDRKVSTHILEDQLNSSYHSADLWTLQILRTYIAYVKTINPELSPAAKEILIAYYKRQRKADIGASARTTIRLLESLIRISQAHARLMFRSKVIVQDAIMAVILMESSNHTSALTGGSSPLHSEFPEDPDLEYFKMEKHIIEHLGLDTSHYVEISSSQLTAKTVYPSQRPMMSTQSRHHNESMDSDDDEDNNNDFNSQTSIISKKDEDEDDDLDDDSRILLERAKAAYAKITANTESVPKIESPLKKYVRLRNSQKGGNKEEEEEEYEDSSIPSSGSVIKSTPDTPMKSQTMVKPSQTTTPQKSQTTPKKTLMTTKKPIQKSPSGPLDVNIPPASPSPQKLKQEKPIVQTTIIVQKVVEKVKEEEEDELELEDEDEPLSVIKQKISSQKSVTTSISSQVSVSHDEGLELEDEEPMIVEPAQAMSSQQDTSFDLLLEDEDEEDVPLVQFKKPKISSQVAMPSESRVPFVPSPALSPIPDASSASLFGEEDLDALELEDETPVLPKKSISELKTPSTTTNQVQNNQSTTTTATKKKRVFLNDD